MLLEPGARRASAGARGNAASRRGPCGIMAPCKVSSRTRPSQAPDDATSSRLRVRAGDDRGNRRQLTRALPPAEALMRSALLLAALTGLALGAGCGSRSLHGDGGHGGAVTRTAGASGANGTGTAGTSGANGTGTAGTGGGSGGGGGRAGNTRPGQRPPGP